MTFPAADVSTAPDDATGDCPAPLAGAQVLEAFRRDARPWTLECDRSQLSGRTWGDGPPLYLLPGLGGTCALMALLVWLLRRDFRCVAIDYPAPVVKRTVARTSAQALATQVLAAADLHRDDRFHLFAAAFGGLVSLEIMLDAPERIMRGVIQGGFAHRNLSPFERLLIRLGRHCPGRLKDIPGRRQIQQQTHRAWFAPFDAGRWDFFLDDTGNVSIAALANRAAMVRDCDFRPRLTEIHTPLLLIRTEGEGRVAARCGDEFRNGLPHARVEELHSTGQLPYLTHPHRMAQLIREFLLATDND